MWTTVNWTLNKLMPDLQPKLHFYTKHNKLHYKKCILETGKKQPEAIQLYKKNGYNKISNYGQYSDIENSLKDSGRGSALKVLFAPRYRKVIILGLLLAVFVQISGINTVVDYAPKILMAAGLEIRNPLLQTSLIGLVNFTFTFLAVWLIDRLGRRTFYIIGSSGMASTLLMLAAAFHFELNPIFTTICIMLFIAFFASCIGPAFWTLVAEMFPNRIRGQAVALASFTQWVFNFLVVLFFPYVLDAFGGSLTFLFLACMALIQLMIAWFLIKETKGKTLEEIEGLWSK